MRTSLFLLFLFTSYSALAQHKIYQDADSPNEAVGIMKTSIVAAAKSLTECGARFPELADSFRKNHETWIAKEARTIRLTQFHWEKATKKDPNLVKMLAYVESIAAQNISNIANAPMAEGAKNAVLTQFCENYFSDLASGIWRERTPRTYQFMDVAPEK